MRSILFVILAVICAVQCEAAERVFITDLAKESSQQGAIAKRIVEGVKKMQAGGDKEKCLAEIDRQKEALCQTPEEKEMLGILRKQLADLEGNDPFKENASKIQELKTKIGSVSKDISTRFKSNYSYIELEIRDKK